MTFPKWVLGTWDDDQVVSCPALHGLKRSRLKRGSEEESILRRRGSAMIGEDQAVPALVRAKLENFVRYATSERTVSKTQSCHAVFRPSPNRDVK